MTKSLREILGDGTLVDNTHHQAVQGVLQSGWRQEKVEIKEGRGVNKPAAVWPFLQRAANLQIDPASIVLRSPQADYEHNTDDSLMVLGGFDPLNFSLTTGNLIGSISSGDHTLRISSRFGDEFLRHIIADADGFAEIPDQGGTAKGGYEWLLNYFWLIQLKKAFRLGLPKSYETRTECLTQVRGRMDPIDCHLNQSRARFACTYREHSYDNPATQLIARTLEHLDARSGVHGLHPLKQTFQTATGGRRHSLQTLLAAPPIRNPYYADYNQVMDLAKRILKGDLADVGHNNQTSALLFDVSMLFEYFIRKLLRKAGLRLHDKATSKWSISAGIPHARRALIPDLVFEHKGRTFVFDVKYKNFHFGGRSPGVNREDIFQLHTYIGQATNHCDVGGCGLIYPVRESEWYNQNLAATGGILTSKIMQGGREIPFHVAFVMVPERGEISESEWGQVFQERFRANLAGLLDRLETSFLDILRYANGRRWGDSEAKHEDDR